VARRDPARPRSRSPPAEARERLPSEEPHLSAASPLLGVDRREAGWLIVRQLELAGWDVELAGREQGGVAVSARRGPLETPVFEGDSLADVAIPLFESARRVLRPVA
jgi:hypothetical protein